MSNTRSNRFQPNARRTRTTGDSNSNRRRRAHSRNRGVSTNITIRPIDVICIGKHDCFFAPQQGTEILLNEVKAQLDHYEHFKSDPIAFEKLCACIVNSLAKTHGTRFIMVTYQNTRNSLAIMSRQQALLVVGSAFMTNGNVSEGSLYLGPVGTAVPSQLAPFKIQPTFCSTSTNATVCIPKAKNNQRFAGSQPQSIQSPSSLHSSAASSIANPFTRLVSYASQLPQTAPISLLHSSISSQKPNVGGANFEPHITEAYNDEQDARDDFKPRAVSLPIEGLSPARRGTALAFVDTSTATKVHQPVPATAAAMPRPRISSSAPPVASVTLVSQQQHTTVANVLVPVSSTVAEEAEAKKDNFDAEKITDTDMSYYLALAGGDFDAADLNATVTTTSIVPIEIAASNSCSGNGKAWRPDHQQQQQQTDISSFIDHIFD